MEGSIPAGYISNLAIAPGILGAAGHYLRFGPKKVDEETK
jgi:hypothetical protein